METMREVREAAHKELFAFINWLATEYPEWWEQICGEYMSRMKK